MNGLPNLKLSNFETIQLRVCSTLRKAILQGVFEPGQHLKQAELAEMLGVSRMPIREALHKLQMEGLLTIEPNKGAVVNAISKHDIEEIYTLRSVLEKMVLEMSIPLMKEEDIEELEQLVLKMETTQDVEQFIQYNNAYHKALIQRCPWRRVLTYVDNLWNGFPQDTPFYFDGQMEKSNQEHRAILEAVKERDSAKASEILSNHILRTLTKLLEHLKK